MQVLGRLRLAQSHILCHLVRTPLSYRVDVL